jgi:PAS domain S-box-containing protein
VGVAGLLTLAEYIFRTNLGIDEILFPRTLMATGVLHPGRMSGATGLGFLFLGSSMLLMSERRPYTAQGVALLTSLNGFVACVGYLLGARALYDVPAYSSIALHTSLLFMMLGMAVIAARPNVGVMAAVTSEYMGGAMARRVMPFTVGVPIFFGWLRWRGQAAGLYGTEFGIALRTLSEVTALSPLLWLSAVWLNRIDKTRREIQRRTYDLATIVASSHDAMLSLDMSSTIISWNRGAEKLFGYRSEEVIGQPVVTIIPTELQGEAEQFLREIRAGRVVACDETVRRHKDGSDIYVSLTISPVRDFEGQIVGSSAIAHDINDRKRRQEALRESQQRLTGIIASAMDSIITVDEEQRIVLFNAAAEKMFHCSEAVALGQPVERFIPERFRTAHSGHIRQFGETGVTNRAMGNLGAIWAVRANGEEFQIEASISQVESGRKKLFTVILRDVTERKQFEAARERLAAVVDSSDDAIISKDLDGMITAWNHGAERLFGYTSSEAVGKSILILLPTEREGEEADILARIRRGERISHFETVRVRKDGKLIEVSVTISPIRDRTGAIIGASKIARDITERKRAEQLLLESQRNYKTLFESMDEGFCTVEVLFDKDNKPVDFRFLEVNPAFLRQTGIKDVRGKRVREIVPQLEEYWFEIYGKIALTGEPARFENEAAQLHRWYDVHAFRIGEPYERKVAIFFDNITVRKRIEEAVQKSEEQFRTMANAMPQLAWMANPDGWIFWYNQGWYDYTATTPQQMEGWGWQSVHDPVRLPEVMERWQASIATGEPFEMTFPLRNAQAEFRSFLTRVAPIKDASGKVLRWFGTNTDIEERQRAELALRESEALLKQAQHTAHMGNWRYYPDGTVTWSDEMYELYKLPRNVPVTYAAVVSVIHPEDRQRSRNAFLQCLQSPASDFQDEHRVVWPDGQVRHLFSISEIHRDHDGRVIDVVGTVQDVTERKRIEQELRESEERFRVFMDNLPAIAWAKDEQGRHVYLNRAYERSFGVRMEDWHGKTDFEVWPPEIATAFRKADNAVLTSGKSLEVAEKTLVEGNVYRTWQNIKFPFKDSKGRKYVGGVGVDITEKQIADERLREYGRVVEGLAEMILVVDREYRYVIANRAFLEFRGFTPQDVIGRTAEEVVGKEVFEGEVKQKMDECFLGHSVQYEMTYDFKNLGKRDLFVSYFPIESPIGIDRIACILQDITERKLAEEELRKSEERFSKAFRNNPLAISISTEADGCFVDVNDAFLTLLRYRREDVVGHTSAELRFWAESSDRTEMLEQLKKQDQIAKRHIRYRNANGTIREADTWTESIDLDGQRCLLGIIHDTTEIQELEAQFRQAQKMEAVGRLAGGVAHDFNNMLGIIIGYSDLSLERIAPEHSEQHRYVSQIKTSAQKAAALTQQLLAFSRKQVVFPKVLDLNEVVRNAMKMFLRLVGEDVKVEFRPSDSLGNIKADPGQIEQILMNLVVNARDAMPTGGRIMIETALGELDEEYASSHPGARSGEYVVLIVSDTGCGMDDTVKSQIFEPFFTTKAVGHGTGLGLSTVYGIVKQSEGYIVVYSEPGKGTTFKICFPSVNEKVMKLVLRHEDTPSPHGAETILIVEDEKHLREVTATILSADGYRVVEVQNAEEALRIIASCPGEVDLLLTDVIMPEKSGAELLAEAKRLYPNLRAVFMSGYTGDMVARHGVLMDEATFLEKPFTKRALLAKVYSVLHGKSDKQS